MNNDRNNWASSAKCSVCTVHVAASSSQSITFHVLLLIGNMNPKVFGPHEDEYSFDCPVSPVLTFKDRLHKPQLDFHQQESLTELSPLLSLFFCCHFSSMLMPLWSTSLCLKLTPHLLHLSSTRCARRPARHLPDCHSTRLTTYISWIMTAHVQPATTGRLHLMMQKLKVCVCVCKRISINEKERRHGQEEQNWELVALSRGVEANQILWPHAY